jgi:hypothetical protein
MVLITQQYKDKSNIYKIQAVNPHNGHKPSLSPEMHPCHQRASPAEEKVINDLTNGGMPPKLILNHPRKSHKDSLLLTTTNIYNIWYCLCAQRLQGLTPIQALFSMPRRSKSGWHYRHQEGHNGHITSLFPVHNSQIKLAQLYPEVLLLDAMYKTNWFNMPLVHFMWVVPVAKRAKNTVDSNMSTAFAFVSAENEDLYTWALQAYEDIVLCCDKN